MFEVLYTSPSRIGDHCSKFPGIMRTSKKMFGLSALHWTCAAKRSVMMFKRSLSLHVAVNTITFTLTIAWISLRHLRCFQKFALQTIKRSPHDTFKSKKKNKHRQLWNFPPALTIVTPTARWVKISHFVNCALHTHDQCSIINTVPEEGHGSSIDHGGKCWNRRRLSSASSSSEAMSWVTKWEARGSSNFLHGRKRCLCKSANGLWEISVFPECSLCAGLHRRWDGQVYCYLRANGSSYVRPGIGVKKQRDISRANRQRS